VFDLLKGWLLRFANVPAEPHAPAGSPGSLKVFRAARNYWTYLLVAWGLKQMSGAVAIVVFLSLTSVWQETARAPQSTAEVGQPRKARDQRFLKQLVVSGWLHDLELIGLGFFLLQMPFSLAAARLDYEMRWYMVTDRSMRLREGIFGVREMTLTFANVQNITIRQGPLQRLLGISDVVVRTAGGGSSEGGGHPAHAQVDTMHTGVLRAVDNAESVRDLILDRLRKLHDAGLGDPDDRHHAATLVAPGEGAVALRAAARELVDEARALRSALT
jgi:hypothetical protein